METQLFVIQSRKKLGLTQEELAKLIGSNKFNISNYETGRAEPPGSVILKIQEIMQSSFDSSRPPTAK